MAWLDEPDHPFIGIAKKLERADENIVNLNSEIASFFSNSKYPVIPDPDNEEWQAATNYHRDLPVPIRFRVLCGEIVHHLRSCLDHIAWHFSSPAYRRDHDNAIQFPILSRNPPTKDELSRYDRNIKGITNPNVLTIIDNLQPYKRGNGSLDDPLCIVHDMDRFDKHRELAIVTTCATLIPRSGFGKSGIQALIKLNQGETLSDVEMAVAYMAVQKDVEVAPQIAFAQFGNRVGKPVIPALTHLLNAVTDAIGLFSDQV